MSAPPSDQVRQQLLAEALQLCRYLLGSLSEDDLELIERRRSRLRQIQKALKEFAHPVRHDRLSPDEIPIAVRQAFVKAVLLVTRYRLVGGGSWHGTLPSPTLSQYSADPIPAALLAEDAIAKLCSQFDLPSLFQEDLAILLHGVDRQIEQQRQIIHAVLEEAGIVPGAAEPLLSSSVLQLFQHLFGDIPILAEAVDCVYTDMQIYFCVNYRDGQLYQRDPDGNSSCLGWYGFSEAERSTLQAFLQSLEQFNFEKFRRFPIFGACDPATIDQAWCDRIAQRLGLTTPDVLHVLTRSVSIIPTQKAEAFLVHDIWGHHWQFLLTQFEGDYSILAACDEPLRAGETAYTSDGPLTCMELFDVQGDRVTLNEERARLFFYSEVRQRLGLLFTHILGEMLADVAEFKFVWNTQSADSLPSSSLFKAEPTKLDLSLTDLDFLFLQVLKPLLEMTLSVLQDTPLEMDLLADWAEAGHQVQSLELRTSLKQAIARLYQIFVEEYNTTYLPTLSGNVGIFTQIVTNLLYLQNVVSSLYTDPVAKAHPALPFQDLLVVFVSSYCSNDSYTEFWDVDDILAAYFLPCWYLSFNANVSGQVESR